ncbi:hypothetical protein [Halomonas huangheensis]|uniref:Uncharacterized protein n=1 Tax=Halomonas huangheensis TaxID=1178482 RepID=W1N6G3_9GAMM|nr:hypothetical protein [Halomonas huangheensis]ALM54193.1 hypothetical protein AR456_19405 [Halomonas huangheensis]ERL51104.1 hypothetical protein BJB45_19225 [Halomonas huangheensis]
MMPLRYPLLTSTIVALVVLLSAPVMAQSLESPELTAMSHLERYDNVIVLDNDEAAHFFQGIRSHESTAAGFRIQVEKEFVIDRIRYAPPGSVIVAADGITTGEIPTDPRCGYLETECGLMATLKETLEAPLYLSEDCLETGGNCLEFVFANAGLVDVIKSGQLRITAPVAIHADDHCFSDSMATAIDSDSDVFSRQIMELDCAGSGPPGAFPLAPSATDAIASMSSFHMQHSNMLDLTARHDGLCEAPRGHWSGVLNPKTRTLTPYEGVELDIDYRAMLLLIQDLHFDNGSVKGEMSLAACQSGEVALNVEAQPDTAMIPIWARASGPRLMVLGGWLPLVYSTTARLDLGLASSANINLNPLLSFASVERYGVNFSAWGPDTNTETTRHFAIELGDWNHVTTTLNTSVRLLPALQINFYGAAGPFAGAELALQGRLSARGGNSTIGTALRSSLNAGIDARIIDQRFTHSWPLSQCGMGGSISETVPSCRDSEHNEAGRSL